VITGVSGSGKSSLAFDTIYAEGQRRYVESLSAYARQFLQMSDKPDVDGIDGLAPAIAIEQKTTSKNPRSTVGTITEIYDYLRLLYANAGRAMCPKHPDVEIEGQTVQQIADALLAWPEGTRVMILAPVVEGRKGEYKKEIAAWQQQGFTRLRLNGEILDIEDTPALDKKLKHTIEVVVDRLALKDDNRQRLTESLEVALKLAEGMVRISPVYKKDEDAVQAEQLFSERHACPVCGTHTALEPRLFSFNSPFGACSACDGLGEIMQFDAALIVPDDQLSLRNGALHPWKNAKSGRYYLDALAKHYGFSLETPWHKLPEAIQGMLLYGSGAELVEFTFKGGKASFKTKKPYDGLIRILERRWVESDNPYQRDDLTRYRIGRSCTTCGGTRLNANALHVFVGGKSIAEFCALPIADALEFAKSLQDSLTGARAQIAAPILREVIARLGFLAHVGLSYLSLNRTSGTLSGGESQRIRLASQIGSGLTGVLYVLDEPSIGLHQRDNQRLLDSLLHLRDLDNTILVVEHDEDAIRQADHVIDVGPKAGEYGGEIIAAGDVDDIMACEASLTGQYLTGVKEVSVPKTRRKAKYNLAIKNARGNNLQGVDVDFPLGVMTCVTGVSGSGKSTLVMDTLHAAIAQKLTASKDIPAPHDGISGLDKIDKIVNIDQSPIGRTPRSNPATYTGLFGPMRDWFAGLPESAARGYKPGRFSFNVKGGRCESCKGDGVIKVEMHFLPDVYVQCEVCKGQRFNRETLEVHYKGKSIADVLHMPVSEAHELFKAVPAIRRRLQTLLDVGLGYIRLGQSATTLSGGEAQRVKLSKELSKVASGKTLYILDEPTTGLHFEDINLLLKVLHRLVDAGNTMVIIEHNLDVIKTADHIIDIGPEGGSGGGEVIAKGTPEVIAKVKNSFTGHYLAPLLAAKKSVKSAKAVA